MGGIATAVVDPGAVLGFFFAGQVLAFVFCSCFGYLGVGYRVGPRGLALELLKRPFFFLVIGEGPFWGGVRLFFPVMPLVSTVIIAVIGVGPCLSWFFRDYFVDLVGGVFVATPDMRLNFFVELFY